MSDVNSKAVDDLFLGFSHPGAPGAAVMVIKDGRVLLARAYGLANLEMKLPCSTNTNFRLASVTKQFTAMAVMIQVERGKLSLDDHIRRFFPELPAYAQEITVRHLLTHTSGLLDYEDLTEGTQGQLKDKDVLRILCQQNRTSFAPGSQFHYSNTGYAFLALIVERTSGTSFAEFLKANIFKPLNMAETVAFEEGISPVSHRALGYAKSGNDFVLSDQSQTSAVLGDGGIYSSVSDLFKWDQALYNEKLVSRRMLEEAFTAASLKSDAPGSGYGFGWYIGRRKDSKYIWHYGSTCGFSTRLARIPEKNLTIIILANRRDAGLSPILEKLLGLEW